jgi:pyruvate-ferredoxin/flavodoxin oxidoreductase
MSSLSPDPAEPWCVDGNEAAADVAYRLSELCALYPITPSSAMGELSDQWAVAKRPNVWGLVPEVIEMQSEAGAAGTLHGAAQAGRLATTFTSSQGLLLMFPSMFKLAGELCPCVFHVAARALSTQALSIFGDHSDVMAVRSAGFALLASASVQEAHDFAAIAHAAAFRSRVPFLHFFDGFRTSHELRPIAQLSDDTLRALVPDASVLAHRARALTPDHPVIRGTSQNPDVFFQAREASNSFYNDLPALVQDLFNELAQHSGRAYHLVDYSGAPDAEDVLVLMGSGAETAAETAAVLHKQGRKVGVLQIRLYRPWPLQAFLAALPASTRRIAVLDRSKEPGAFGEALYLDVAASVLQSGRPIQVIGGRYGLGSKEFTPAMVKAVFDLLASGQLQRRFTVGITDDVTHLSLPVDPSWQLEDPSATRALFFGLGSDGTVGANRNSIRILSERPGLHTQGFFVFDSNKSGSRTVSHLRFGPKPIRAPYLIQSASFIACHAFAFLEQIDILEHAAPGAVLLLNAPHAPERLYERLPSAMVGRIRDLQLRVYVIDAQRVARDAGLGIHINTVMQTCFFAISGVLPRDEALDAIRDSIRVSYGKKGNETVARNLAAVEATLAQLHEVPPPAPGCDTRAIPPLSNDVPDFVRRVTLPLLAGKGDLLPVSALPPDGTWPLGTSTYNKRDLSPVAPLWDPDLCIQCGVCVVICPHGVIRVKQAATSDLADAPPGFPAPALRGGEDNRRYLLQLHLPDCTGCGLCIDICPAKSKTQANRKALVQVEKAPHLETNRVHLDFFNRVPEQHEHTQSNTLRGVQYLPQRFEFPGACAGCGETAVLKLASQLFGDRMLIANATGCSSIYGGNLPTTPWTPDAQGRGPAWANSLFEDNAEFGLGFRIAADQQRREAEKLLSAFRRDGLDPRLVDDLLAAPQDLPSEIEAQRARIRDVLHWLGARQDSDALRLRSLADSLVARSVWIVGGDGWACDIGFGGLDHVLASGRNVNLLVLDTEVYSNTGGQASKSTPLGAVAKFAAAGKATRKTDLALHAILKGNVYVATIALGAKLPQALRAIKEAEAYPGPSLILAYSPCIAHGYPLSRSLLQQTRAVESGHWPLLRCNPALKAQGKPALVFDSAAEPTLALKEYLYGELRYKLLDLTNPETAQAFLKEAEQGIRERLALLKKLSE